MSQFYMLELIVFSIYAFFYTDSMSEMVIYSMVLITLAAAYALFTLIELKNVKSIEMKNLAQECKEKEYREIHLRLYNKYKRHFTNGQHRALNAMTLKKVLGQMERLGIDEVNTRYEKYGI